MHNIHMILTIKGGVGKSFIAAILAQYLGKGTYLADTDPGNPTFSSYKALGAQHINIMHESMSVNRRCFDQMIDTMVDYDGDCLVDNGSSSFLPLMSYMIEGDTLEQLRDGGKNVIFHAVIVGGIGRDETVRALEAMLHSRAAPVVIWENEFFGPVEKDGKRFHESEIFTRYADQIVGIVRIAERKPDTYGQDIHMMTSNKWTFDEVEDQCAGTQRTRIRRVKNELYAQLDQLSVLRQPKLLEASDA